MGVEGLGDRVSFTKGKRHRVGDGGRSAMKLWGRLFEGSKFHVTYVLPQ